MDLPQKRTYILRMAAQYGARNLRVFGSVARGDDRAHGDVDLLVDMDPDRSFLDIVGPGQDLEELLTSGRCVEGPRFRGLRRGVAHDRRAAHDA